MNLRPEWSPDGTHILFRSQRGGKLGVWWQPSDGRAKAELLYEPEEPFNEAILSPDAKWLIYRTAPGGRHSADIMAVPLTGDRRPVPLVTGPAIESLPRVSPDGKWLAYQSNESGRVEIYVRPFMNAGARVQVSDLGGAEPLWARSGRALYYRTLDGIVSVAVTTGASVSIGDRRTVLTGEYLTDPAHADYDVAQDGSQFLMLKRVGGALKGVIVHNWGRELREKLAAGKK
jgi:Tol biopolymer transport system component